MRLLGRSIWVGGLLLGLAGVGFADRVVLRDGTVRRGIVEGRSGEEVRLRIDRDGIRAVVVIPADQVWAIEREAATTAPAVAGTRPVVGAVGVAARVPGNAGLKAPGSSVSGVARGAGAATTGGKGSADFLTELAASLVGHGPDDPARLPVELQELWKSVMEADKAGDKLELLGAMDALENVFRLEENGQAVIDAVGLREKGVAFSVWMARTRWEMVSGKYRNGQFDLRDMRPNEKPTMIALLRKSTGPAVDPLRAYFPAAGDGAAGAAGQVTGITVGNCLELKEKALYASAVLMAQLKLEPEMPGVDRALLGGQLVMVRRVLSRTLDLEPQARMALEKLEREKKLAEERAKAAALKKGG